MAPHAGVRGRWAVAKRLNVSAPNPWEPVVGYSRAVRIGPHVHVSGTTSADSAGGIVGLGDPYAQAREALGKIEQALRAAGAAMEDVVRTRTYLTDIDHWEAVARAHAEVFRDIRPAATMVEIRRLVSPEMPVEIEVDAIVVPRRRPSRGKSRPR